jgi:HPt (histidine-containing phosphotransfer) domain-containing protein
MIEPIPRSSDGSVRTNQSAEELANLDRAIALSRVGGDLELLQEIARLFLDDTPRMLSEIRQAIEAGDPIAVERSAHSLKGCIANFGTGAVFEAALALENKGRGGDLSGAPELYARIESLMNRLEPELQALTVE